MYSKAQEKTQKSNLTSLKLRHFEQIFRTEIGCPVENAILLYLIWRANPNHVPLAAFPSHARIAKDLDTSVSTVIRKLKSLEVKGFIEIQPRNRGPKQQTSNLYVIQGYKLDATKKATLDQAPE